VYYLLLKTSAHVSEISHCNILDITRAVRINPGLSYRSQFQEGRFRSENVTVNDIPVQEENEDNPMWAIQDSTVSMNKSMTAT
jgi:hypothetical protein